MSSAKLSTFLNAFKDGQGRIVIGQWPNLPIVGWLIFQLLAQLVPDGRYRLACDTLGTAFLFTWAYLELTRGVNYFRRALGLVVLAYIVITLFVFG